MLSVVFQTGTVELKNLIFIESVIIQQQYCQ